jgi:formylglycine-generating enzyme
VQAHGMERHPPCCAASRPGSGQDEDSAARTAQVTRVSSTSKGVTLGTVGLDGGVFLMGTDDPARFPNDGEGPVRTVALRPFWIDTVVVSNARFATFVDATGYVTEAERYGWSFVFGGLLPDDFPPTRGAAQPRGGGKSSVRTGATRRVHTAPSRTGWTTRWFMSHGTTRWPIARGPE